jgi:hypothetical protein
MSARYWIAQYVSDPFRNEPRNIGVFVEANGALAIRFFAEGGPGQIDGRKLRAFKSPEVYRQWINFWRAEIAAKPPASLVELSGSHYRVIEGGGVDDIEADTADDVANYLYALLVSEGGFSEALALQGDVEEPAVALLADEVGDALKEEGLLSTNDIFVPHPVRRFVPIVGKINIQHRPAFVQENGHLYVIETVDFTIQRKKIARDHAGWSAYMFSDIHAARSETSPIAIVRFTEADAADDEVANGLALLRHEGHVVNWLDPRDRESFLEERRAVALAK